MKTIFEKLLHFSYLAYKAPIFSEKQRS